MKENSHSLFDIDGYNAIQVIASESMYNTLNAVMYENNGKAYRKDRLNTFERIRRKHHGIGKLKSLCISLRVKNRKPSYMSNISHFDIGLDDSSFQYP